MLIPWLKSNHSDPSSLSQALSHSFHIMGAQQFKAMSAISPEQVAIVACSLVRDDFSRWTVVY